MEINEERLVRFAEGDLPEAEAEEIRRRLDGEPGLRLRLERLHHLTDTLRSNAPASFAPYFSTRVMRRLSTRAEGAGSLYESLRWIFARAAVASLALAVLLGAYNAVEYQTLDVATSTIEAVFGLPSDTIADALSYGSM